MKKRLIVIVIAALLVAGCVVGGILLYRHNSKKEPTKTDVFLPMPDEIVCYGWNGGMRQLSAEEAAQLYGFFTGLMTSCENTKIVELYKSQSDIEGISRVEFKYHTRHCYTGELPYVAEDETVPDAWLWGNVTFDSIVLLMPDHESLIPIRVLDGVYYNMPTWLDGNGAFMSLRFPEAQLNQFKLDVQAYMPE